MTSPPAPEELAALLAALRSREGQVRVITGEARDPLTTWRQRREAALGLTPRRQRMLPVWPRL